MCFCRIRDFGSPTICFTNAEDCLQVSLRILRMCCKSNENAKHGYLIYNMHITGVYICLNLSGPVQISLFSFKFGLLSTSALHSVKMSTRIHGNPYKRLTITYKRLTITTNALPSIRMAYDCSRICCKYAFLTNMRSMFLIFPIPRECL